MLNNLTNFLSIFTKGRLKKTLNDSDIIPIGTRDPKFGGGYKPTAARFDLLKNKILESVPESPLPELKEVVTYVTAEQLRGEDPLWLGTNITNLTDSENNYPSDIDVLIEYTWDHADFDLNGTQAILGTGSGTVIQLPETFFTQNYGGVYGTRLFIGPSGRPEYVGVGADTNIYFRILPTPSWLNGNGSLRIITTYRERTYGN